MANICGNCILNQELQVSKFGPSYTARTIRCPEEYERFFHTKAYLRSLEAAGNSSSKLTGEDKITLSRMMKASKYANLSKFLEHKKDWDSLHRKIPLSYLEYLGYDRDVLTFTLALDFQEYRAALDLPRRPKFAFVRLLTSVFIREPLPDNILEDKAIEYIKYNMGENHLYYCINYPELKTIFIEPEGKIITAYYPPEIEFTQSYASPKPDGSRITGSSLA